MFIMCMYMCTYNVHVFMYMLYADIHDVHVHMSIMCMFIYTGKVYMYSLAIRKEIYVFLIKCYDIIMS